MTKVPERRLSYGELLNKLKLKEKREQRLQEQEKALKPKKPRTQTQPHNYTYEEVLKILGDWQQPYHVLVYTRTFTIYN